MTEKNQQQLNELYTRLQMIDQQIKHVQSQMQLVEEQMQQLAGVTESLNELSGVEKGNEILIPVAGGIFVRAIIDDPSQLLVNVGSSVNVAKSITEVITMLTEQGKELEKTYLHMQEQFQALFDEATSINGKISPLIP